jgi:hypothetical protein
MSSAVQTQQPVLDHGTDPGLLEVRIYSHTGLFYWWPVWALGYLLAILTYFQGKDVPFSDPGKVIAPIEKGAAPIDKGAAADGVDDAERSATTVRIHPSKNLGVIFTVVTLLVILMTNVAVRGVSSLTVIIAILAMTFLFAYLGWWDDIFHGLTFLAMYMNQGFYIFFSTALFGIWALSFFIFDRFNYWKFRPGQMVHYQTFGGGEQTHDTQGMAVHKLRDDLFRHWILGLGSGDMHVVTTGAVRQEFVIHNVLFVGSKLRRIQRLVAMKPDDEGQHVITAGNPD